MKYTLYSLVSCKRNVKNLQMNSNTCGKTKLEKTHDAVLKMHPEMPSEVLQLNWQWPTRAIRTTRSCDSKEVVDCWVQGIHIFLEYLSALWLRRPNWKQVRGQSRIHIGTMFGEYLAPDGQLHFKVRVCCIYAPENCPCAATRWQQNPLRPGTLPI